MRLLVLNRRETESLVTPVTQGVVPTSERTVSLLDEGKTLRVVTLDEPLSKAIAFSTGARQTVCLLRPHDGALLAVIDGIPSGAGAADVGLVYQRALESGRGMWVDFSDRPDRFGYLP